MKLISTQPKPILQKLIGFTDQLNVSILNPVVNHLYVVSGAVLTYPVAARRSILDLCRNSLKDLLNVRPSSRIPPGHNRRSKTCALLPARNPGTDKQDSL